MTDVVISTYLKSDSYPEDIINVVGSINLILKESIPGDEHYIFIFSGNSQPLLRILVGNRLAMKK